MLMNIYDKMSRGVLDKVECVFVCERESLLGRILEVYTHVRMHVARLYVCLYMNEYTYAYIHMLM